MAHNCLIYSDLSVLAEFGGTHRRRVLVEAAGIEPASEKGHYEEPTCLVHSKISTAGCE